MPRSQPVALLTCAVLVAVSLAPAAGAATGPAEPSGTIQEDQFDRTTYTIEVFENGSARWTVSYRRPLANESEVTEFRSYADRFNSQETELYAGFRTRASALTAEAGNRTGRDMTATGFTKQAVVRDQVGTRIGVVEMSFVWTGFAAEEEGTLEIGDVFEGGFFIAPSERLVIRPGPNVTITSVSPTPDRETERSVAWDGGEDGQQFLSSRPQVMFRERGARPIDQSGDGGLAGLPLWLVGTMLVVVALGGAVVYRSGALAETDGTDPPAGAAAADTAETGEPSGGSDGAGADGEAAVADEELLSDEDRVLRLLEGNGGRMKQVNIVDETGWSKSKVSMLLSDMEDDGDISKLRVGRENIISIAGEEPEGVSSPFDDE